MGLILPIFEVQDCLCVEPSETTEGLAVLGHHTAWCGTTWIQVEESTRCVAVGSPVEPISVHLNQNHSKDEGDCLSGLSLLLPLTAEGWMMILPWNEGHAACAHLHSETYRVLKFYRHSQEAGVLVSGDTEKTEAWENKVSFPRFPSV